MEDLESGSVHEPYHQEPHHKKQWSLRKIIAALIFSAILFGAGLTVGRGDIHLNGLSLPKKGQILNSDNLDYSSVNQVYKLLQKDFDGSLNKNKLIDGLKSGLVNAAGDPYTEYFNSKEAQDFNNELAGSISGIGAELGKQNNSIVIVSPLSGFPAEKAGLKPKDVIAAIDGKPTTDLSVDAAVNKIRGPSGSKVTLTVVRNSGVPFEVTITRQKITVPSVKWQVDGPIGYLKISQFSNDTTGLTQKAADEFKAKNVKGIVLDLRGNPGGYLSGAVNLSSLWLDEGKTVVEERRGVQVVKTDKAIGNSIFKGTPTVVLIDAGSASASEITAGALKDNGAATLEGEKSFGKGSVQTVESLPGGSELKVTIARWFTPAGKNIDKQGITPDVVVTISEEDSKAGKDPQKDRAYQILSQKIH